MAIGLANFLADSHSRQQFLSASRRILQPSATATLEVRRTLRTERRVSSPEILPLNTAERLPPHHCIRMEGTPFERALYCVAGGRDLEKRNGVMREASMAVVRLALSFMP